VIAPAALLSALYAIATTVGPTSDTRINDLYVYSVYARFLRQGLVPYRDFGFEYPPLALGPIALGGSAFAFAVAMLVALLVAQWCVGELGGREAAWAFALTPVLLGAMVRTHFDAVAAALAIGGVLALVRERPRLGMGLLAAGGMVKLFPLLLAALGVAWLLSRGERRAAWQGAAVAAVVCLVCVAPFAGGGLVDTVRFHLDRPVQIESTPATVLFAAGGTYVTGYPVRPDPYKSNGLAGGASGTVDALFTVALVLALIGCVALAARGADLVLVSLLALLAFVALGKVLSPQYLIWLAPFAAVAWTRGARAPAAVVAASAILTQVEFPARYFDLVARDGFAIGVVAARNALLLVAAVMLAAALARSTRRAAAAPSSAPRPR
jgi:Glycosyltransferase family 87